MRSIKMLVYFCLALAYNVLCEGCWRVGDRITLMGDWADNQRVRLVLLQRGQRVVRQNTRREKGEC